MKYIELVELLIAGNFGNIFAIGATWFMHRRLGAYYIQRGFMRADEKSFLIILPALILILANVNSILSNLKFAFGHGKFVRRPENMQWNDDWMYLIGILAILIVPLIMFGFNFSKWKAVLMYYGAYFLWLFAFFFSLIATGVPFQD